MANRLSLHPYGPDAWLLRFAKQPGAAAFQAMRAIVRALESDPPAGLVEYVPGYTHLLIEFAPGQAPGDIDGLAARLERQLDQAVEPGPLRDIPVVYDGPDLGRVAEHAGLSIAEVIERHAGTEYRVALIGFAPGFPYLDGLDPALATPRLATPRPRVEAGSVAIGGEHTGIYSVPGPGGWNLIGRTQVRLFDPARATPDDPAAMCWLRPGDRVRFVASDTLSRAAAHPSPPKGEGLPPPLPPPTSLPSPLAGEGPGERGIELAERGMAEQAPKASPLEVLTPGLLATVQDGGRPGWRRYGVPPGGAMDRGAWREANRLLDNPEDAAVLECLQGMRLVALAAVELAAAGAWGARAWRAAPGEVVEFPASLAGVWHYLALPGGIDAQRFLGSASVCARAGIGRSLAKGDRLASLAAPLGRFPAGVKARQPTETVAYGDAPLGIWPGPQWDAFDEASRTAFLTGGWRVSARSDRTGYRLEGAALVPPPGNLASEPVRVGSVQVPPDGQPLVTLHDGPTVGGYAKIALIDAADLDRLVQTRPGQAVRFRSLA